ncbi:hypothetical protein Acid345_0980 [Candidatus Koribacter versatilis Ellin345]|uniref:Uncharacterized protein n=1 Tax=Koribacter versatilis (strain Ellin345) TaxID=204669 RepID=Q1IT17_KORVE|nr:PIN domain-containing protein [Candidatus Koribacter versatilis]ABF39983.1 hypothetical protein Acid345_0980 [Candidatus Koribacter versatilis Ellin345]
MHKFVFLDTNIFEHFPPITDIDWPRLADCDSVTLVISPVTIGELNRHKDGANRPRLKQRAATAIRLLSTYERLGGTPTVRTGTDILFLPNEPLINFAEHRLSSDIPDDRLLASAIEYALDHTLPSDRVLVTSADLGLTIKGKSKINVKMLAMDESLRIPQELEPEEKRIAELESQLQAFTARSPKLTLMFEDGDLFRSTRISRAEKQLTLNELSEEIGQLKKQYPYLAPTLGPTGYAYFQGGPEICRRYNGELNEFFKAYEKFLIEEVESENWNERTRSISLVLRNDGGIPADDIDVWLDFPEDLDLLSDEDFLEPPVEPDPPQHPGERRHPATAGFFDSKVAQEPEDEPSNARLVEIQRGASSSVHFVVARLKHTMKEALPTVHVHFPRITSVRSFGFKYRIVAANYPKPFEGQLNMKVDLCD